MIDEAVVETPIGEKQEAAADQELKASTNNEPEWLTTAMNPALPHWKKPLEKIYPSLAKENSYFNNLVAFCDKYFAHPSEAKTEHAFPDRASEISKDPLAATYVLTPLLSQLPRLNNRSQIEIATSIYSSFLDHQEEYGTTIPLSDTVNYLENEGVDLSGIFGLLLHKAAELQQNGH